MANPWDDDEIIAPAQPGILQQAGNLLAEGAAHAGNNFIGALGDIDNGMRLFANGATFGGADAAAAALSGATGVGGPATTDGQQLQTQIARDELGMAGTAAELGGAVAPGLLIPGAATATIGRAMATGGVMGAAETVPRAYFDTGELPDISDVVTGAVFGAGAGAAGYKLGNIMQRPALDAAKTRAVDLLTAEGVDVTAGQATGIPKLLQREGGAGGAVEFAEKQAKQFSTAALRRAGITAEEGKLTPEVLSDGFKIVGQQMDQLAANNSMKGPAALPHFRTMLQNTHDIYREYIDALDTGSPAPIMQKAMKKLFEYAQPNKGMSGEQYQELMTGLEAAARSNPRLAPSARAMRGAIDEGMEGWISATNPADAGLWKMSRRRFANLLVIEDASTRAGRDAASGLITPSNLASATKAVRGKRAYARGKTDFDDLATAGQSVIRTLPVAAHATPREMARVISSKLGQSVALGGATGMYSGSPAMGIGGALAAPMASAAMDAASSARLLTPMSSLSPTAAATGGRMGASLGGGMMGNNPFSNLLEE